MSYFRTNDRYLTPAPADAPLEPPWGVEALAEGGVGGIVLRWRPPYTAVDSYGVVGQQATGAPLPSAWRELGRVTAPTTTLRLALGPGTWHLVVVARRGAAESTSATVAVMQEWGPGTVPPPVEPAAVPEQATAPPVTQPEVGPVCPVCGGRVAVGAEGGATCAYCGLAVAITADGRALALDRLLYGPCACCVPRRPLIRQGDVLRCPAHPERSYGLATGTGGELPPAPAAPPAAPTPQPAGPALEWDWAAIDTALRDNSAQLGQHGLFVRGG